MARPVTARLVTYLVCAGVGAVLHAAWTHEGTPSSAVQTIDAAAPTCPPSPSTPAPACPKCEPTTCPPASPEPEPEPEPVDAQPKQPPVMPLPAMPGRTLLSTDERWDPERSSWLLVQTYDVPVRRGLAVEFYEKAIAGLDMKLVMNAEQEDKDGAMRSVLRGRRAKDHVQISLRQAPDQLLTRVRVMWRTWD